MNSLFRCPLCSAMLTRQEHVYTCPNGHSFDRSAEGYTHLLPANRKHSKNPGDDKQMVAARCAFLERGYYAPLRDELAGLALRLTEQLPAPHVFDSGCGEGYYTTQLFRTLSQAGKAPRIAGIDISKFAVKRAAKRLKEGEFAVASAYHLPAADSSFHLLTNVFSPLCAEEFSRILAPGGWFVYVVPSGRHLWQMKQVLYDEPYENPIKVECYTGFTLQETLPLRYTIDLTCPEDIRALFSMTPYAWKTPRAGVLRLNELQRLKTEVGFDIHVYRRI